MSSPSSNPIFVKFFKLFLATTFLAVLLPAQTFDYGPFPVPLPPADAGVPYDYTLIPGLDEILTDSSVTFSGSVSGDIPPGMSVSAGTRVSGTPTRPGTYTFNLTIVITAGDESGVVTIRFIFAPTLVVRGNATGGLSVDGGALSFNFTQGGASTTQSRTVRLTNRSAVARTVSVNASSQPAGWLSTSGGTSVGAYSTSTVTITATAGNLAPGVYSGSVEITSSGGANEKFSLPAILAIASSGPAVSTSQTGITFEVQQGTPASLSQTFQVSAANTTTLAYSTVATAIAGGNWLQVSPASGNLTPTAPATVSAGITSQALTAGTYYGQIEVRADAAANSPRTVNVVLNVKPAGAQVTPRVSPTAAVLVQRPGAPIALQTVAVTNVSNAPIPLGVGVAFDGPNPGWFTARSLADTIGPGQTVNVEISRNTAVRLTPGVYSAEIALRLGDSQRRVNVVLIIPQVPGNAAAGNSFAAGDTPRGLDGCTASKLVPVFTTLGSSFTAVAAFPSALEMRVVDDCGDPMLRGLVTVSFSTGEPPLPLTSLGDGRWSGTWQPKAGVQNVVLTAEARTDAAPQLLGNSQIGGSAAANTTTPIISSGGIVSAAAPKFAGTPLAPGSYVSIFGSAMANGLTVAPSLPFPTDLAGTQVLLGGKRLPLQFAADGQINALVPFDVALNVQQLLVVRRGNALSTPEQVVVAQTQPAVFTKDQSGAGEGIVVGARADGAQFLIAPNAPVTAGEALIIYCTGLGPVNPAVAAGAAAPSDPLATTVSPVTVTVGGKPAGVFFAGMAPGFAGLYQVNAILPEGITPGAAVELVVSVAGQSSRPVTIAIK